MKLLICFYLIVTFIYSQGDNLVITNAQVLLPNKSNFMSNATLYIKNGTIKDIRFDKNRNVPQNAIDAKGMFIIPGFMDMHTHVRTERDMLLNLRFGITTALNMGSRARTLKLRDQSEKLSIPGPDLYVSAYVDGIQPTYWYIDSPESVERNIFLIDSMNYDFIKVYSHIKQDIYYEIIKQARDKNITVIGHGVRDVGIYESIKRGQKMIAHMEEFMYAHFDGLDITSMKTDPILAMMADKDVYVTTTMITFKNINRQWGNRYVDHLSRVLEQSRMKYIDNKTINAWKSSTKYSTRKGNLDRQQYFLEQMMLTFKQNNISLMLGSDAPDPNNVGIIAGVSLIDEIKYIHSLGISSRDVINMATEIPGKFLELYHRSKPKVGKIEIGYRANLLLLEDNPLENLQNINSLKTVIKRGRKYDLKELDKKLVTEK